MNALGLRLASLMLELMEKEWWDMLKVTLEAKIKQFDTINFNTFFLKKKNSRFLTEPTSTTFYDWTVFLLAKSSRRRRASAQTGLKRVFEQLAPTKAFLDLLVAPATFS